MKKNKFLYTDLSLIPLFLLLLSTGVVLHAAPFSTHQQWHNWVVAHIVSAVLFLILAVVHIKQH